MRFGKSSPGDFRRCDKIGNLQAAIRNRKMAFSRTAALEYLQRAHQQNRLAHAYLISGPPGSGKQLLAAELASLVNGTKADEVFSSKAREIFVARPESRSRRIVISQIRELEHALQMRASNGQRKVAIISEADRLQPQAANAFLKTLEEPPKDSLLLLLSALPEALPDTILSRCIPIPLAPNGEHKNKLENEKLVKLLQQTAREQSWTVQYAYRLAQGFQRLLRLSREQIKAETDEALKEEEARYRNSTDGAWLDEREEYYKALTESLYLQRRANLIEILFAWWTDILRASSGIDRRDLPDARKETAAVAKRFTTPEVLRKIRRLEELRDQLGRNIQEGLAIEVTFLRIFGS
jgi:DNA polymerase III subunit delta'